MGFVNIDVIDLAKNHLQRSLDRRHKLIGKTNYASSSRTADTPEQSLHSDTMVALYFGGASLRLGQDGSNSRYNISTSDYVSSHRWLLRSPVVGVAVTSFVPWLEHCRQLTSSTTLNHHQCWKDDKLSELASSISKFRLSPVSADANFNFNC